MYKIMTDYVDKEDVKLHESAAHAAALAVLKEEAGEVPPRPETQARAILAALGRECEPQTVKKFAELYTRELKSAKSTLEITAAYREPLPKNADDVIVYIQKLGSRI